MMVILKSTDLNYNVKNSQIHKHNVSNKKMWRRCRTTLSGTDILFSGNIVHSNSDIDTNCLLFVGYRGEKCVAIFDVRCIKVYAGAESGSTCRITKIK